MQLSQIIQDTKTVALTLRRSLAPLEGEQVPVFPPTYPADKTTKKHVLETPYTINKLRDGTYIADLDSVQSQANRMEAAFAGPLADCVPQHLIRAGDKTLKLVELPHRLADAVARASDLKERIAAAMNAYDAGNPGDVAKLCPTALVYGAWDSRDTKVKIPRAVRSEIRAFDVAIATRSAQFSGSFDREQLGFSEDEWKKGADAGFAPTPSVNAHGGVYVRGEIIHNASIMLAALRRGEDSLLKPYLLGLALRGLLHAMSETRLRVGCELLPNGPAQWLRVEADGSRHALDIDSDDIQQQLKDSATKWADSASVTLGMPGEVHAFDPKIAKTTVKDAAKEASKSKED